jgi:hypothetical protein
MTTRQVISGLGQLDFPANLIFSASIDDVAIALQSKRVVSV